MASFKPSWRQEFISEFLGSAILVFIGEGGNAVGRFRPALDGHGPDHLGKAVSWGLGASLACLVTIRISGSCVNPAHTVAKACLSRLPLWKVPPYILAEYLGSLVGSFLVFALNYDILVHLHGQRREVIGINGTASAWIPVPREWTSVETMVMDQGLCTCFCVFICLVVGDMGAPPFVPPIYVGLSVTAMVYGYNVNCMSPMNPARDLGARVCLWIVGYGTEVFSSTKFTYVGALAMYGGGFLAAGLYTVTVAPSSNFGCGCTRAASQSWTLESDLATKSNPIPTISLSTFHNGDLPRKIHHTYQQTQFCSSIS